MIGEIDALQWVLIGASALAIGLNKVGLTGVAMIAIPIMAGVFGAQRSTGVVLPMLIIADIVAVSYYRRHAQWPAVVRLLPWTAVGLAAGVLVGEAIPDSLFRRLVAVAVLVSVALLAFQHVRGKQLSVTPSWWSAALLGIAGGFTTMVGNAAGPIMILYLVSMGLQKNAFIGTGAWFFFIVNLVKVPLHVIFWETITVQTLLVVLAAAPAILLGTWIGLRIVKRIPERAYQLFILVSTAVVSIRLLF